MYFSGQKDQAIIFSDMRAQFFHAPASSLLLCWLAVPVVAWGQLYMAPEYLGDIKRNALGELVAVPAPNAALPPVTASSTAPQPQQAHPTLPGSSAMPSPSLRTKPHALVQPSQAPSATLPHTLRVGPHQDYQTISAAAAAARSGDTVEIDSGDYVADTAVWRQNKLTIRGVGGTVHLIAAGASAEGKAIWVIGGGDITVENIMFSGARVRDHNGAGIRFEKGRLTVKNCIFLYNESGLLTANDAQAELVIENSEFGNSGFGNGMDYKLYHSLYVGHIKKLTVTGSYFHHTKNGHLLKSRAGENHIFYNRITDETGGAASYELEFPNGGIAYLVGNIIQQSSTTQNPIIVSMGAEGYTWPKNELYLSQNTIVDDLPKGGLFLRYYPGLTKLLAANNVLVGEGALDGGLRRKGFELVESLLDKKQVSANPMDVSVSIQSENNVTTGWQSFTQASRFDYRGKDGALTAFKPVKLASANGVVLTPSREYVHPASTRALTTPPLLPGAVQDRSGGMPK